MSRVLLATSLFILLATPAALAQDAEKADNEEPQRKVYRLKHVPATDLAVVLKQVLRREDAVDGKKPVITNDVLILAEPVTNSLVLSGSAKVIEETVDLIEDLDRRPALVQVRALIAEISTDESEGMLDDLAASAEVQSIDELAAAMEKRPGLRVLSRPQLAVLDNQPGALKIESRTPRITGVATGPAGQTNRVSMENVGMNLTVRARTGPEGLVTMEVDLQKSQFGPEEKGAPIAVREGKTIRKPAIETLTLTTTVEVRNGQTLLVGGVGDKSEARRTELILLISARIVEPK